jgi:hypothetical protein
MGQGVFVRRTMLVVLGIIAVIAFISISAAYQPRG